MDACAESPIENCACNQRMAANSSVTENLRSFISCFKVFGDAKVCQVRFVALARNDAGATSPNRPAGLPL